MLIGLTLLGLTLLGFIIAIMVIGSMVILVLKGNLKNDFLLPSFMNSFPQVSIEKMGKEEDCMSTHDDRLVGKRIKLGDKRIGFRQY